MRVTTVIKLIIIGILILLLLALWFNMPFLDRLSVQTKQIFFLWLSLGFLILIGTPISISLGISALLTAVYVKLPLLAVFQKLAFGINSFAFASIAFFVLLGQTVNYTGMTDDLIKLANLMIGRFRGGFAYVNVLASMLFGGISGSAVADVASLGLVEIPMMERQGYSKEFSTALTVTSSIEGIIIPPSQNMIIYALAAGGVSVGTLFAAGYLPGLVLGLSQMAMIFVIGRIKKFPRGEPVPKEEIAKILLRSLPVLLVGFITVFGIIFGFFTATESSAFGALLAFIVGFIFHKESRSWRNLVMIFKESASTSATVLFLIANASAFSYLMAYLRIPTYLTQTILSISNDRAVILLMINLLLLLLGLVMDMAPLIVIMTPVLLPLVQSVGMTAEQFGVVMIINLGIGLCTPPVGNALFTGCAVGKTTLEKTTVAMLPLYVAMIGALFLITYVPWITTIVPKLLGLMK
ncbi:MAG TPA: TRAP transporter large permease [Pseudothermotoga sp.]|nr:TRAP transporter large permease [Pseudothermotoga sp.]